MATGLRDLPSDNVRVVEAETPCHPLGNLGWLLQNRLQPSLYSHFVLVNSRVRGPFLPPYAQVRRGGGALPLPPRACDSGSGTPDPAPCPTQSGCWAGRASSRGTLWSHGDCGMTCAWSARR